MNNNEFCDIYEKIKPIKLVVLDTETAMSGEVIQVAYNIYLYYPELDNFQCIENYDWLINEYINKIDFYGKFTLEDIYRNGKHPEFVFKTIAEHLKDAKYIVGHNIKFDTDKLEKYFKKLNIEYKMPTQICTMKASKERLGLKNIKGYIKFPKLSELYLWYYKEEADQTKTHTADYDIHLTFLCFEAIYRDKLITI